MCFHCCHMNAAELLSERSEVRDDSNLLTELVDGLILLYNMSAHKQLGKVRTFSDVWKLFINVHTAILSVISQV